MLEGKIRNRDGERYIKKLRICCQKSALLSKMYVPGETLVLSFTNKACQNITSILGKDAKVYTFDSKFYNEDGKNLLSNVKRILVDECSMTPLRSNQCKPVETHNRDIDYTNQKNFREMCDNNMMTKEYVEGCAQYDKELYDVLEYLKKHKRLPNTLKVTKIKPELEVNIS